MIMNNHKVNLHSNPPSLVSFNDCPLEQVSKYDHMKLITKLIANSLNKIYFLEKIRTLTDPRTVVHKLKS